jgi:hypothetical protein
MTTPRLEDVADLDEVDIAALQAALDLTTTERPDQMRYILKRDGWRGAAEFGSYAQQMQSLNLHPAQSPPCWIITEAEANEILAEGPAPAAHDPDIDVSNCEAAKLLLRMLRAGVSPYHPDPVAAVEAAKKARR